MSVAVIVTAEELAGLQRDLERALGMAQSHGNRVEALWTKVGRLADDELIPADLNDALVGHTREMWIERRRVDQARALLAVATVADGGFRDSELEQLTLRYRCAMNHPSGTFTTRDRAFNSMLDRRNALRTEAGYAYADIAYRAALKLHPGPVQS